MFIAREKRKTNIAEYLLYMWQIEDIIRAYKFDINLIKQNIVDAFNLSEDVKKEMIEWYDNLLQMMCNENIKESGHLQINKNIVIDLTHLHLSILETKTDLQYINAYQRAFPFILDLSNKQKKQDVDEIEVCFNALYLLLMLKLQKKEISESTQNAVQHISRFLALLSDRYKKMEEEEAIK